MDFLSSIPKFMHFSFEMTYQGKQISIDCFLNLTPAGGRGTGECRIVKEQTDDICINLRWSMDSIHRCMEYLPNIMQTCMPMPYGCWYLRPAGN